MSEDRTGEDGFFGRGEATPAPPAAPPRPPRRESALLARSPVFAVLTAALAGWLLASLWPDVAYFFSPRTPIDLGGPGAYRLEQARENRLVQLRGPFAPNAIPILERGAHRTVGLVAGTHVLVSRPGLSGPPLYEGRLVPAAQQGEYQAVVEAMRARGAGVPDGWAVLRDGDRPRSAWLPVIGSALLLAVLAINLRALVRALVPRPRERR